MDLVALSNGLHGSVQMDSVALFSWIGWLRHHGILNLVIKIKNTFNNEIRYNKEELMSTKEGHSGLGIKSVKSVVSKYQGEIRMDITDNMFSVLIIIPFHP